MIRKSKPPQSDLFRAMEEPEDAEPEDVKRALAGLEMSMRDYARRILAERKAKTGHGNDD